MYSHLLFKADNVITEQANTFRTERIQMTSSQYINIPQGSVVGLSLTPFIFCLGSSPNFETRIPNSLLLPNLLCVGHITNYLTFNRKKYGFSCSWIQRLPAVQPMRTRRGSAAVLRAAGQAWICCLCSGTQTEGLRVFTISRSSFPQQKRTMLPRAEALKGTISFSSTFHHSKQVMQPGPASKDQRSTGFSHWLRKSKWLFAGMII